MLMLVLLVLLAAAPRLLGPLFAVVADIHEARAMALLYRNLAALSDRELAARGLKREDIPRVVLATIIGT